MDIWPHDSSGRTQELTHTTLCGRILKLPTRVAGGTSYHTTPSVRGDRFPARICSSRWTHSPTCLDHTRPFSMWKKEQKAHWQRIKWKGPDFDFFCDKKSPDFAQLLKKQKNCLFKFDQTICHYIVFNNGKRYINTYLIPSNEIWQICHDKKYQYCHVKKTQIVEKFMWTKTKNWHFSKENFAVCVTKNTKCWKSSMNKEICHGRLVSKNCRVLYDEFIVCEKT